MSKAGERGFPAGVSLTVEAARSVGALADVGGGLAVFAADAAWFATLMGDGLIL